MYNVHKWFRFSFSFFFLFLSSFYLRNQIQPQPPKPNDSEYIKRERRNKNKKPEPITRIDDGKTRTQRKPDNNNEKINKHRKRCAKTTNHQIIKSRAYLWTDLAGRVECAWRSPARISTANSPDPFPWMLAANWRCRDLSDPAPVAA